MKFDFKNLCEDLFLPVVVCKNNDDFPIHYMNTKARLLLAPTYSVEEIKGKMLKNSNLNKILQFKTNEEYQDFFRRLCDETHVDDYRSEIITPDQSVIPVNISGVTISIDEPDDYFILYILTSSTDIFERYSREFASIVNSLFFIDDPDSAINSILARAGRILKVSRVYVFEEISETSTRNTYEWCATGIEPAIQDLQDLKKSDYNYDVIVESGMYVTEDVSSLPDEDREILEMQGIKSLAIVTIYSNKKPLGYVGFDDCEKSRIWSHDEIQFLQNLSAFISTLIVRRKTDDEIQNSLNIMQLISDSSEKLMYANSMDYKLLFVNKAVADMLGKRPEELIGKLCYKVLRENMDGPCPFCPMPKINWNEENNESSIYSWEYFNPATQKTYLTNDNLVKWVDGKLAHIETSMDISKRVEYESQLRYYASTDMMIGIPNREFGSLNLSGKLENNEGGSLCFIDIDGLKFTNDTYGHLAGDELLKESIRIIRETISADSYICRWGGDEFLLWMKFNTAETEQILKNIQKIMDNYNKEKKKKFKLSFSYGIVPLEKDEKNVNLDNLITMADQLMYKNKMEKRYNPALQ